MKIQRRFTTKGQDVFSTVEWTHRSSRISNTDGSLVFEMNDAEVPANWSQLATDIMVSKYFRKAGVPQMTAEGTPKTDSEGKAITGPERSVKQVVHRLCGCWRAWGQTHGYFETTEDADAFYDELAWMLLNQVAAPNSPQWFNTGLNWAYGITGPAQGHFVPNPDTGEVTQANDAYTHPQPHACFIQSVRDDLVGDGGIMDLWTREARLFKYGSGTGTNFSTIRGDGEALSGGGKSSGLMSFLKIGDRAASAIKSGGTTRRAAKMVCLDVDHPDIEEFVNWKVREEIKVAAMVEGLRVLSEDQRELADKLGLQLDYDFNGEAYLTVSGQNSNNSVRISDEFFEAVDQSKDWSLTSRIDGEVTKTLEAIELWDQICTAAWRCADPGIQFDSTINSWHTCPDSGRINASNPCSEYMFLDDTACNLASINLMQLFDINGCTFDTEGFEHAVNLWTIVLEISVLMAAYPSEIIASQSYHYRTLGLGYANLGAMLMQAGIPYDSEEGRAICGALSAILTGRSYATSATMASEQGAFPGFEENRESMLRVMRNHRRAAYGTPRSSDAYESLTITPVPIEHELLTTEQSRLGNATQLSVRATKAWDDALTLGKRFGFRNAQTTVIAPTGTIGLLMDCDTTGVEPDFALTKFKKLAGGGYFKIANQSLRPALNTLGYAPDQVDAMLTYVMGTLSLDTPIPQTKLTLREHLLEFGYKSEDLVEVENALPTVFELGFAFSAWSMPAHVLEHLNVSLEDARNNPTFDGLKTLGLSAAQIESLNVTICGTQTIEGAPHIQDEHLPVFDCANKCGKIGQRFIAPTGHIHMMAAAQPFISGAISKTINLPNDASIEDISSAYRLSWELGLKANALYRDGCKLSQPLNTKSDVSLEDEEDEDDVNEAINEVAIEVIEAATQVSITEENDTDASKDQAQSPAFVERIVERIIERPMRRRLPDTRHSITHHFNVAGHEGYLTVGQYEDGSPGELFITMSKEGSTIGGLMDSLGTAISVALQYGVPVESLVTKFAHQRFEPMGMTTNRDIPFAKSLVDYIFRWLGMQFIAGYREANAPQRTEKETPRSETSRQEAIGVKGAEENQMTTRDAKEGTPCQSESGQTSGTTAGAHRLGLENQTPSNLSTQTSADGGTTSRVTLPGDTGPSGTPSGEVKTGGASASLTTVVKHETIAVRSETIEQTSDYAETLPASRAIDHSNASMMGDAPACDGCGSITVRNGSCYKCMNCGNSMGCS
ncbi:MAG: adenosylcobalamin-dependent ribonucleoside-diphosphate reductase [Phycisphaerales bacterium]|nr:adenosylcobalamin-dependent ribonucleoside-diphosphate reductase [Phycisphaerales bacterium]